MQQQGGSHYGVPQPGMVPPFTSTATVPRQPRMIGIHISADHLRNQPVAEAASPISSRPAPQPQAVSSRSPASIFDELGGGVVTRSFADEDALGAGEEGERGGGSGNRWPRQETLALLKIRSEMDAAFRDSTLKGPLWEDVSRKLAEVGYTRRAKKCKEKFENVHKYYKRTKEGRAGRQDGKSYRFFSQLEALQSTTTATATATDNVTAVSSFSSAPIINSFPPLTNGSGVQPPPDQPAQPTALAPSRSAPELAPTASPGAAISFSSNTASSSSTDGEDTDDCGTGVLQDGSRKRKRERWLSGSGKTMAFFEGLMKQLMERQEAMQQRFLETIEKREQDRMVREEAWKRQEIARLNREYELMAQERTMAANRDAAVISFLKKFTGEVITNPSNPTLEAAAAISAPAAPPQVTRPEKEISHQGNEIVIHQPSASSEQAEMAGCCLDIVSLSTSLLSSRWPKTEILALIKLRSELETRYIEAGPKGPLWEEISLGMKRLGYNRSTKRCKEKWENINKYFKKVKEGNKKRHEDAKTCPYFHELDALYRKKQQQETAINPAPSISDALAEQESLNGGNKNPAIIRSNGNGFSQVFFGGAPISGSGGALKKPENIVKTLTEQQNHENDEDDDDDNDYQDDYQDDDSEDGKLRYEIQFQRQSVGAGAGARGGNEAGKGPGVPPASNASSFLAMVQ